MVKDLSDRIATVKVHKIGCKLYFEGKMAEWLSSSPYLNPLGQCSSNFFH